MELEFTPWENIPDHIKLKEWKKALERAKQKEDYEECARIKEKIQQLESE